MQFMNYTDSTITTISWDSDLGATLNQNSTARFRTALPFSLHITSLEIPDGLIDVGTSDLSNNSHIIQVSWSEHEATFLDRSSNNSYAATLPTSACGKVRLTGPGGEGLILLGDKFGWSAPYQLIIRRGQHSLPALIMSTYIQARFQGFSGSDRWRCSPSLYHRRHGKQPPQPYLESGIV